MSVQDQPWNLVHCPQCDRPRRITEWNAFNGKDKTRSTLNCGHVVNKEEVES